MQPAFLSLFNQSWKEIPNQKMKVFCTLASILSQPTQNPICINIHQAIQDYIKNYEDREVAKKMITAMKSLNRIEDIPKTKGRLCGGLLAKGDKAYKCFDCMTEDNSVLCPKCFELDKHIGHDFERLQVHGGCCDCGDIQKWKEEGFCCQHSKDEEIQVSLDEKILGLFLEEQLYGLQILLRLYEKLVYFQEKVMAEKWQLPQMNDIQEKMKEETIKKATRLVDIYGGAYIDQLIQFNKAGKFANAMTDTFFRKKLALFDKQEMKNEMNEKQTFIHLFSMAKLSLTPEKVADLCITMFPMLGFREKVTETYIQFYNNDSNFPPSSYTHLSSQLMTSYLSISKLVRQGRMKALRYQPVCNSPKEIQRIAEGYVRYYYDIKYLSKLYGDASLDYFKLHAHQKMFVALGHYRILFDNFQEAIDYYGLQAVYLQRMLHVINLMQRDVSNEIANMALRELYEFITSAPTSFHNKFRPQERLFTLILFARFRGDLQMLDKTEVITDLFTIFGVKDFQKEMIHLLRNISSIFILSSKMMEDPKEVESKYTFYSFYLKKSQLLFNLDSILLKIAIKMCSFYNSQKPFQFASFIIEGKYNPITLVKELDQACYTVQETVLIFKHFISYVNLITEAIVSDLPILAVACLLQPTDSKIKQQKLSSIDYEKLALHYYECLLRSQETNRVSIKQFKKSVQIFFKEQKVFKNFVNIHRDNSDNLKLVRIETKGPRIESIFFRSIRSMSEQKYKTGQISIPYQTRANHQFLQSLLEPIFDGIYLLKSCHQKSEIYEIYEKYYKNKLVPYLVLELWKIGLFMDSQYPSDLLQQLLTEPWINEQLQVLRKELRAAISSEDQPNFNNQQQEKKAEMKRKMLQKRALIKEKMNKNTEKALQNESITASEISEMKNESQLICCLCKQQNSQQQLYLLGFVTFTSGNRWFGLGQNLIPIFDWCRHAVHVSCYEKIVLNNNSNRVYVHCPLCKKPVNILLPEKEKFSDDDKNHFLQSLKKVYDTLQYKSDYSSLANDLCKSLSFQCISKGLLMPEQFFRNINVYKTVYRLYQATIKSIMEEQKTELEKQLKIAQKVNIIFKQINNFITSLLNNVKSIQKLPQILAEKGENLINLLAGKTQICHSTVEPLELNVFKESINFPVLQKMLSELNSRYRGKCSECGLVTNNQMICLTCSNFVVCANCTKISLIQHSNTFHLGLTIYIKTSTGEPLYLMRNRSWKFQSLYQDYMGRIYSGSFNSREDYALNMKRLQDVKKDVLLMRVEQKVRYKQFITKKVFNREIY